MSEAIAKNGKMYCPHCDWPLKHKGAAWLCGICGSEFAAAPLAAAYVPTAAAPSQAESERQLQFARELLARENKVPEPSHETLVHVTSLAKLPRWKMTLSYLGFPVEEHPAGSHAVPLVALGLMGLCGVIVLLAPDAEPKLWLDPHQLGRAWGLNFISYSFTASGFLHLIFDLLFLWPFLLNVEEDLGAFRTGILWAAGAAGTAFVHLLLGQGRALPLVGTSGVAYAVMSYYCLRFPKNRFLIAAPLIGFVFYRYRLRLSAVGMFVIYIATEYLTFSAEGDGMSNVSHAGHVGGALVGLVAYFLWSKRQ